VLLIQDILKPVLFFLQLNADVNAFQRKFVNEVRRCDELERKLRYIEAEINKENLYIPEIEDLPNAPNPREITDLEVHQSCIIVN
jgi:V-type H+-transporting ATPase subunit a